MVTALMVQMLRAWILQCRVHFWANACYWVLHLDAMHAGWDKHESSMYAVISMVQGSANEYFL